jgi:hypothetical protein
VSPLCVLYFVAGGIAASLAWSILAVAISIRAPIAVLAFVVRRLRVADVTGRPIGEVANDLEKSARRLERATWRGAESPGEM